MSCAMRFGYEVIVVADPGVQGDREVLFDRRGVLGEGGMGVVYDALDRRTGERVALKTLLDPTPRDIVAFKDEFRTLADLHHPNLVQLFELFVGHSADGVEAKPDALFFTMQLIDGARTFYDAVTEAVSESPTDERARLVVEGTITEDAIDAAPARTTLSTKRASRRALEPLLRAALTQLAQGLEALHAAGFVHRDLKPSNVLVTRDDRVVITDFGLVTDAGARGAQGTPLYMAPEQARGEPAGPEADWYSVGVMLFECLVGECPFAAEGSLGALMTAKMLRDAPKVRSLEPNAPEDLALLCDALLDRSPTARPGAERVLDVLGARSRSSAARAPFVGRSIERGRLSAWFDAPRSGPSLCLVEGPSGQGKSALVRAYAAELPRDVLVLKGRCHEREHVPFLALDGVVDGLSRTLASLSRAEQESLLGPGVGALARSFPALRAVAAVAAVMGGSGADGRARDEAFAALRSLLCGLCARRGRVLVVIDDLQWADADSVLLLRSLVTGPDAPPLSLLATVRGACAQIHWLQSLPCSQEVLSLGPLRDEDARALVSAVAGDGVARAVAVDALLREGSGHPLFLEQLAREQRADDGADVATSLEALLWRRSRRLDPAASALLDVLCVAREPLPALLAADAAGLAHGALWPSLGALRTAFLAHTADAVAHRPIEPTHARVADAVLARLAAEREREIHGRLARALERSGAAERSPAQLVRHLEGAGEHARAASLAETAAQRANEALAFEQAAGLYRAALRLSAASEHARLQLALGEALVRCGRGAEAAEAFLGGAEGLTGHARLSAQSRGVDQLLGAGDSERGLAVLRRIAREAGVSLPGTHAEALVSLLWHRVRITLRGLALPPPDAPRASEEALLRLDLLRSLGMGLSQLGMLQGEDMQARSLLLALDCGDPVRLARALLFESLFHCRDEKPAHRAHARRLRAMAEELNRRTGDPLMCSYSVLVDGFSAMLDGDLPSASTLMWTSAHDPVLLAGGSHYRNLSRQVLLLVRGLFEGSVGPTARWFDELVRDGERRGDGFSKATLESLGVGRWLLEEDFERADEAARGEVWRGREARNAERYVTWLDHSCLWASCSTALYRADEGRLRTALRQCAKADRLFLMREVVPMRLRHDWLAAAMALALAQRPGGAEALGEARARIALIRARKNPIAWPVATALEAAVAATVGDAPRALDGLRRARRAALHAGLPSLGHGCGYWLGARGDRQDDRAAHEAALRWYAELGAKDPRRAAWMHAPGFAPERAFAPWSKG
jgi:serine/threonine protein kinase